MEFNILGQNELQKWKEILDGFPTGIQDIYYLPEYYLIWQEYENAQPCCAYFEDEGVKFLYPFFLKEITGYKLPGKYYDIFTAYGYGGVVSNSKSGIAISTITKFNNVLNDWLLQNKVVTEFIRQDPFFEIHYRHADYTKVRQNVYVENHEGYEPPSRQARKNLRRAEKSGLEVKFDPGFKNISGFMELYNKSAARLGMESFYFFPESYYRNVSRYLDGHAGLLHIFKEENMVCSLLYFEYATKLSCHLLGSDPAFNDTRMNDLVYKSAVDYAISKGFQYTHLGGGLSNDPEDSLFKFKEKFGTLVRDVFIGKNILIPGVYSELCAQWEKKYPGLSEKYSNHVLKYRYTG